MPNPGLHVLYIPAIPHPFSFPTWVLEFAIICLDLCMNSCIYFRYLHFSCAEYSLMHINCTQLCLSLYLCISVSLHLCISASLHLCISASLHLCISVSGLPPPQAAPPSAGGGVLAASRGGPPGGQDNISKGFLGAPYLGAPLILSLYVLVKPYLSKCLYRYC